MRTADSDWSSDVCSSDLLDFHGKMPTLIDHLLQFV